MADSIPPSISVGMLDDAELERAQGWHDDEVCGTEMASGETCERPADECPYHG